MPADMDGPSFSSIPLLRWLNKKTIDNLGLIIAFFAAAFAGWSGYEAHEARKDALAGLKIAQRVYLDVRGHKAGDSGGGTEYRHTLAAYGSSPAFHVSDHIICWTGIGSRVHAVIGPMEGDLAFFRASNVSLVSPSNRSMPPDEMLPGGSYESMLLCLPWQSPGQPEAGMIAFGEVEYKDIFGDAHYKNFCYYDPAFLPTNKTAPQLMPCTVHNDGN
jgi:hypothetical protein